MIKYYSFSEKAAVIFETAALDKYDFTTCQRSDGSYYGTGGQCRKGTPAELPKKEAKAKKIKSSGDGASSPQEAKKNIGNLPGKESTSEQYKRAAAAPPDYRDNLDDKQYKVVKQYTKGNTATTMNDCSRGGDCSKATQTKMKKFDEALKELPDNAAGASHFRGMVLDKAQRDQLANLKPGDTFVDKGYASYSRSPEIANRFAKLDEKGSNFGRQYDDTKKWPVIMESRSKSLRNVEDISDYFLEQEAVLPRGTTQTVSEVKNINGVIYMYTE